VARPPSCGTQPVFLRDHHAEQHRLERRRQHGQRGERGTRLMAGQRLVQVGDGQIQEDVEILL
jgi:hypothetical protein